MHNFKSIQPNKMQLRNRSINQVEKTRTIPLEPDIPNDPATGLFMQEVKSLMANFNSTMDHKERIYHLADLYGYLTLQLPRFKNEKTLQKFMETIKEKTPHHFDSFSNLLRRYSDDDKFIRELERLSFCMIEVMKMLSNR